MKDKENKNECACHDKERSCHIHEECENDKCQCAEPDGECSCDECHCDEHAGDDNCECNDCHDTAKPKEIDYKSLYINTLADFDNFRKRTMTSLADARLDGKIDALNTILPALDNFRQASSMITDKNTLIGLQYIEKNIMSALQSLGVEKIDASGQFDPTLHCAVSTDSESELPAGAIVKELASGYKLGDKVIRYSQVIVKK